MSIQQVKKGNYVSYNATQDRGMETFFDSYYGKILKKTRNIVLVEVIPLNENQKKETKEIPLLYFETQGYTEILEQGLSDLSHKKATYRAKVISIDTMCNIIQEEITSKSNAMRNVMQTKRAILALNKLLKNVA